MIEQDCSSCRKKVVTFKQRYTYPTMPADTDNMVRKYEDTICSYCGNIIDHKWVDEPTSP